MRNERLNLLLRKNAGRFKLKDYEQFFINLNLKDLEYIDLEQSDKVLDSIKQLFPIVKSDDEMIEGNATLKDSKLLFETFNSINENDLCYIFVDEVEICGMFKANTQSSLYKCLEAAKSTYQNTFFLTDCDFKFSFTINYYDEEDRYDKDKFDIQRRTRI
ncbi:MAG: hypothetical protein AAGC65_19570 [Mucilaginibacter sp.]|uniref:hypothetical protein n=1 Tax=Mucilaginibacter sp. TaxID=1882438 RepID=UPI0031ABC086